MINRVNRMDTQLLTDLAQATGYNHDVQWSVPTSYHDI